MDVFTIEIQFVFPFFKINKNSKDMTKICVLVDWSQAFVDEDGSFYGGATQQEKDNACKLVMMCDRIINFTDIHSKESKEFIPNGGIYPVHNLVDADRSVGDKKNSSARVTQSIQEAINSKKLTTGIIIPNNVVYQTGSTPMNIDSILDTFDNPKHIHSPEDNSYGYIISCKHFFNGTALQYLPFGSLHDEFTAATLLQYQFGDGEGLTFYLSGVVTGICVVHTAAGLKQMFPHSRVVIVKDACHPLIGKVYGIESESQNDAVVSALCHQIGIEYSPISTVLQGTSQ